MSIDTTFLTENEIGFGKKGGGTRNRVMSYYEKYSADALRSHQDLLKEFDKKYRTLAALANTLLYPDPNTITSFQTVFDGLEKAPVSKEIECPNAPKRK